MKKLFLIVGFMAVVATTRAQEVFAKDDFVGHAGIGIGSYLGGDPYKLSVLPLALSGEYGILDSFIRGKAAVGVGGYLAYAASKVPHTRARVSHFVLGVRGVFHYQFVEKLDTYAGISCGYNIETEKHTEGNSYPGSSAIIPASFIGARYYVNDQWALFAEIGYGIAPLELGVAFKF
ncbi:MAG: hypothetical protein LBP56_00800 [Odoribacteraceae bacterium]|nr:hypothetical protein [Odoribacteraceae bacterium]